jgi:hypothetical protein
MDHTIHTQRKTTKRDEELDEDGENARGQCKQAS